MCSWSRRQGCHRVYTPDALTQSLNTQPTPQLTLCVWSESLESRRIKPLPREKEGAGTLQACIDLHSSHDERCRPDAKDPWSSAACDTSRELKAEVCGALLPIFLHAGLTAPCQVTKT